MKAKPRERSSCLYGRANVYADLGYRDPERMLAKAQLVSRIAELLIHHYVATHGYLPPAEFVEAVAAGTPVPGEW
ncbi:MAG: DUF7919 family protein [Steroidobacteraceae bacterium]